MYPAPSSLPTSPASLSWTETAESARVRASQWREEAQGQSERTPAPAWAQLPDCIASCSSAVRCKARLASVSEGNTRRGERVATRSPHVTHRGVVCTSPERLVARKIEPQAPRKYTVTAQSQPDANDQRRLLGLISWQLSSCSGLRRRLAGCVCTTLRYVQLRLRTSSYRRSPPSAVAESSGGPPVCELCPAVPPF